VPEHNARAPFFGQDGFVDEKILQMARSEIWGERARAGQLIAGHDDPESEAVALQLLRDPGDTGVTQVMVESLIEQRGPNAVRLILRGVAQGASDGYDEPGEQMLWSLDEAWRSSGLDLPGALGDVLAENDGGDELVGAVRAVRWLRERGSLELSAAAETALQAQA
jgi:hypothetical protein